MDIKIAQRDRPFSHQPGTKVLLPGSGLILQVYPARLVIDTVGVFDWEIVGPVEEFTVLLDLERGCVVVWGRARNGFFRYRVHSCGAGVACYAERLPEPGIHYKGIAEGLWLRGGYIYTHPQARELYLPPSSERLSFGCTKKPEWELIEQRNSLEEQFPLIVRLAQQQPTVPRAKGGIMHIVEELQSALTQHDKIAFQHKFQTLLQIIYQGLLVPTQADVRYQGLALPAVEIDSPHSLIQESARLIRESLIHLQGNTLAILPLLPPQLHCGRYLNVRCGSLALVDLEWTKKFPRRLIITALTTTRIHLKFPRDVQSYRLRHADCPQIPYNVSINEPFSLQEGCVYWLDRFFSN